MANYLVTGGCGFIGSNLTRRLVKQGNKVIILDIAASTKCDKSAQYVEFVTGDVCDPVIVHELMQKVDGCFHLAAIASVPLSYQDWLGTHKINSTGTIVVFDTARRARKQPVPVVYMSSAAVYGDVSNGALKEDAHLYPASPYAADKAACEYFGRVAASAFQVPNIGFRLFNAFGPNADADSPYAGVIVKFVDRILRDAPIEIYGDGLQTRDFIHVDDVISALIVGMQKASTTSAIYNICTGVSCSVLNLVKLIAKITNKQLIPLFDKAKNNGVLHSLGDPLKAQRELGFSATITLEEGLKRFITDYKC